MAALRLVFMGTPDFAVSALAALVDAGHEIVCVYSQPPRRSGRGHRETPSPVHAFAEAHGLTVRHPISLNDADIQREFAELSADAAVVAAYGLILPQAILDAPRLGCLNIHASLLPRWRGAAPIQRAIAAGDAETGVTIMQMDAGLDTGDMLLVETVPIGAKTTGGALHDSLAALGARLIVEALAALADGGLPATHQPEAGVTYARKIDRAEARIDWSRPADEIERLCRAFDPWPGLWFEYENERVRVLSAKVVAADGTPGTVLDDDLTIACGAGALRPTRLQRPGRAAMPAGELLRGHPIAAGTRLPLAEGTLP